MPVPVSVAVDGKQMQRAFKKADTGSCWVDLVIACWQPFAALPVNFIVINQSALCLVLRPNNKVNCMLRREKVK